MTVEEIRTHIRYHGWASRKVLEAAMALPPEDQIKPMGVSHGSLAKTLTHVYLADRVWYKRTAEPDLDMPSWDTEIPIETLAVDWVALHQRWEAWADSLTDESVQRVIQYRLLNGSASESPTIYIVLHVVNHGTLHRGQVVGMLRQLGVKPPNTDLIYYFRELAAAAASAKS